MKIPLSEFWLWPDEDKAYAIAYYRVKNTMVAYEDYLSARERKK